jgi:hypothetical protein
MDNHSLDKLRLSLHLTHSPLIDEHAEYQQSSARPIFLLTEPTYNDLPTTTTQLYLSDSSLSSCSSCSDSTISSGSLSSISLCHIHRVAVADIHKPLPHLPEPSSTLNTRLGASVIELLNLIEIFETDVELQVERLQADILNTRQFIASVRRERYHRQMTISPRSIVASPKHEQHGRFCHSSIPRTGAVEGISNVGPNGFDVRRQRPYLYCIQSA